MTKNQWRMYVVRQWVDEFVWPVYWQLWGKWTQERKL